MQRIKKEIKRCKIELKFKKNSPSVATSSNTMPKHWIVTPRPCSFLVCWVHACPFIFSRNGPGEQRMEVLDGGREFHPSPTLHSIPNTPSTPSSSTLATLHSNSTTSNLVRPHQTTSPLLHFPPHLHPTLVQCWVPRREEVNTHIHTTTNTHTSATTASPSVSSARPTKATPPLLRGCPTTRSRGGRRRWTTTQAQYIHVMSFFLYLFWTKSHLGRYLCFI